MVSFDEGGWGIGRAFIKRQEWCEGREVDGVLRGLWGWRGLVRQSLR